MTDKRIPLGFYRPPKPLDEMTDEEREAWSRAVADAMAEVAAGVATLKSMEGPADAARARPDGEQGQRMSVRERRYARTLLQLQRWARIRVDAGGSPDIIGPAIGHSALLQRMLVEGKDPLPLPPPKFHRVPWYALIEERGADLGAHEVVVADDTVAIGRVTGWRILETVIPGSSCVVTYPGRAIGRWSLERTGDGDASGWRLTRITVGPGADWEHHVAHVTRRIERFFADPTGRSSSSSRAERGTSRSARSSAPSTSTATSTSGTRRPARRTSATRGRPQAPPTGSTPSGSPIRTRARRATSSGRAPLRSMPERSPRTCSSSSPRGTGWNPPTPC